MSAYAVVNEKFLLPLDKAVEVVKLLAEAEGVEITYSSNGKWKQAPNEAPTLNVVSAAQYAALKLL